MNPTIAGLLTVVIWGLSALLVTYLGRIPPFELTAITWFLSLLLMSIYFRAKGENMTAYFKRPLGDYLLVAGGMGGYTALFYVAFKYAPAFEVNILNYLWPIFLLLFLIAFKNVSATPMNIAGMVLGFAGCFFLSYTHEGPAFAAGFSIGHLVMIIAAAWWALYSCFTHGKDYPVGFMVPVFFVCGLFTLFLHFLFEETVMPDVQEWIVLISIGLCRLAYALWDYAMRYGDRVLITSASYFTPLLSSLVLIAGGHGAANPSIAVGAVLIIAGCLVVNGDQLVKLMRRP